MLAALLQRVLWPWECSSPQEEPPCNPSRIKCHSAMEQPATELLPLSLPCQDVPVEQIFVIKTHCHKLLFEFLLILQSKQS